MTIAAVILAASVESALADAAGVARIRRIADAAWSGGALPIIVVSPDPDGAVAAVLSGAPVTLAPPAPIEGGPIAGIVRGIELAAAEVSGTSGALVWPANLCWVGPETITSLVERHGPFPGDLLRPSFHGEVGWPALVPRRAVDALRTLAPTATLDELLDALVATGTIESRPIDLGDPGTVIDGATRREDLPPYEGPAESSGSQDWGAALASMPDEAPLDGPARADDPAG
ncbi:MAG: NTP transferase domain-containing protein [Chloroflexi bacterium]|nr:NTP transferase domain-containing protein [Chloroflexota bacterium]